MEPKERLILTVTCYGHFMSHFNMLAFPALVLPLAARLQMEMADVLGLSFGMYLMFGLSALPWGMAADRWGPSRLFKLFFLGAGISSLVSAWWIDTPARLTYSLTAIGLFAGIYHPIGLGMISKGVSRVSMAMGYNGMFGNLGLAMSPLLTGLVNFLWGLQAVYLFLGLLNLAGLVMLSLLPRMAPHSRDTEKTTDPERITTPFFILLLAMMMGGIAYRGATVVFPAYLELKNQAVFGWLHTVSGLNLSSNIVATSITALILLFGMLGQYTGGRMAERHNPLYCYFVFHVLTLPAVLLMAHIADMPLILVAAFYFFFLLGMQPMENTLVARFTPKRLHHSAFGIKFILTFGVGALAVKMVKAVQGHWGIESVFNFLGLSTLILILSIIVLIIHTRSSRD